MTNPVVDCTVNDRCISPTDSRFLAYLRGLAILVIVFGHCGGGWVFKPYSGFLNVFVPVFFSLSGAVCYHSYRRSHSVGDYITKRVVGLLTPYYLLCLLSLVLKQANAGGVRHGCFIEISGDTVRSQR
jgi:peptidoglycan/LPS O-acetylase OafA/YrhL